MEYEVEECGRRIANLRITHGYTQERLTDALNMDRSILSCVEAGKRTLPVDWFVQLSAFFGVSLDYLILGRINGNDMKLLRADIDELIANLKAFKRKI